MGEFSSSITFGKCPSDSFTGFVAGLDHRIGHLV
jgi:hypothetical protein